MPDAKARYRCCQAWERGVSDASYQKIHERTGILGSIGSYATFFCNRIRIDTLKNR
jgi:hypothetical protein